MSDSIIFREDVLVESKKLSVGGDFDVNDTVVIASATGNVTGVNDITTTGNAVIGGSTNFQGNVSANGTQFLDVTTGALSNIGTVGCGAVTSTGAVVGTSVGDGTVSLAGDGTITGVTSMNASGTLTGTTVTDGTLTVTGGDVTGAGPIACTSINCSGTISGDVDLDQLKANSSVTLNKDRSTWTELSTITGSSGCYILQVRSHTDDNANSVFICTSDGTTGTCSRLASSAGSTSSVKIQARWSAATSIEVKYESSWSGGTGTVGAYAISLFPAA